VSHRRLRPPAVAGMFYPSDAGPLRAALRRCFVDAVAPRHGACVPLAIVVPHAGYVYSGPVAASAYLRVQPARTTIRRVLLLGPSHRVPLSGLALSSADAWVTPLGEVPLDTAVTSALGAFPFVGVSDVAHAPEHSLEVQVPFLQTVLADFSLVPMVVGDASADEVAAVIEALWSPDTLVVVSTDLSHYHRYADAARLDARTAAAIAALRPDDIRPDDACGARPLRGLLTTAERRHLSIEQLDLRNSGDTAGDKERVVGYGAFALA
jgi:MEMO1 family protein